MVTQKYPDDRSQMSDKATGISNSMERPLKSENIAIRLKNFSLRPRRHPAVHWLAFFISLLSLYLIIAWTINWDEPVSRTWVVLDIVLGVIFAFEFFTRSGFGWNRAVYIRTRFFDFIAIVPVLALVQHGFAYEAVWVWLILAARAARAVDRLLGDGFVRRNTLALVEGFEEEITDRVFMRIIDRIQADIDRGNFAIEVANSFARNKSSLLRRIRIATTPDGIAQSLAHLVGLDTALERVEERAYDNIVEILKSPEVDHAIHDAIDSTLAELREEIGAKDWKKHLGLRYKI